MAEAEEFIAVWRRKKAYLVRNGYKYGKGIRNYGFLKNKMGKGNLEVT